MYERFFGFRERPFDLTPNPRYLIMTEGHREALSSLEYAITSHKGITLLLGEAGSGKTTIIRTALARQTATVHCVHVSNPALTRDEFIELLALRFELTPRARESKAVFLIELEALLKHRHEAGESTLLIIDEAQSLSFELLEEIRLLANIETNDQKLLSLVIAGQPELALRLNDTSLRQLKQRVALRCELRPLTLPETLAYISGRIRAAGGVAPQVFTREAVALLHERSGGIPRAINVIADNALLTGFGRGESPINSRILEEVARDFQANGSAGLMPVATVERELPSEAVQEQKPTAAPVLGAPMASTTAAPNEPAAADRPIVTDGSAPAPAAPNPVSAPAPAAADFTPADGEEPRGFSLFGVFTAKRRRFSLLSRRGIA